MSQSLCLFSVTFMRCELRASYSCLLRLDCTEAPANFLLPA